MDLEQEFLRRRAVELEKELEVANARWVFLFLFISLDYSLSILAASAWQRKTDSRRWTRTPPT